MKEIFQACSFLVLGRRAKQLCFGYALGIRTRRLDGISYHTMEHYRSDAVAPSAPEDALSEARLNGTDHTFAFYRALRDRIGPGKPIWLTETAEAACGGNRWDATFPIRSDTSISSDGSQRSAFRS